MIRALNEHYILTVHLSFLDTDVNLNFIIIFILIQMPTVQKYYIIKLTFSHHLAFLHKTDYFNYIKAVFFSNTESTGVNNQIDFSKDLSMYD